MTQRTKHAITAALSWKQALRRAATLTGTVSLIALAGGAVWIGSTTLATRASAVVAPPPAAIVTVAALRVLPSSQFVSTRAFHGQIEAAEIVDLGFEQSGRLNVLNVNEGERVERGQSLAKLDTRILMTEHARLVASRAALEAQAELSRRTAARQSKLRTRGFASDQAVDNVALGLSAIEAQMAEVDAAIAQVDVHLSQTELLAPFDGVIGARFVDPGAIITAATPIVEVRKGAAPIFRVGIDPELAPLVSDAASTITIGGTAYPAQFTGFRSDLDPQTRTRTALFEIETDEPVYLAAGTLTLKVTQDVAGHAVPLSALRDGVRGLWSVTVFSPHDQDTYVAQAAAVEILHIEDDTAYVRGTLDGDVVILPDGTHRIVPGSVVRIADLN